MIGLCINSISACQVHLRAESAPVKRELGVIPRRSGHCDQGVRRIYPLYVNHMRRSVTQRSESQETCLLRIRLKLPSKVFRLYIDMECLIESIACSAGNLERNLCIV